MSKIPEYLSDVITGNSLVDTFVKFICGFNYNKFLDLYEFSISRKTSNSKIVDIWAISEVYISQNNCLDSGNIRV